MTLNGYGKILEVDLSTRKITKRELPDDWPMKYLGGMGFTTRILYDEVGPQVEPFSRENILVFGVGPLTGTQAPCSGRHEVSTKSPLTDAIGTGNSGGVWGAKLKHAGIDVLVIRNEAAKPVYLVIDDDKVEFRDASHLWGKDTKETSDLIREELRHGAESEFSVLTIGPAGENLVRFAALLNDYGHVAAREGAGAVAGAKKLKAIAVRGTGTVNIARPKEFQEAARKARERVLAAKRAARMPGAPADGRVLYQQLGCLAGKNYQVGVMPNWENRSQAEAEKYAIGKDQTCYACPVSCFEVVEVKEGKYAGLQVHRGTLTGVVLDWGAKVALQDLPAIWKCKEQCQKLGLDYASTSGVISLALELFQRGIITTKDTHGLKLEWGNDDAAVQLVRDIAFRRDLGDILAEGSVRAAQHIGHGAEKYVMTIKGMEMMLPDPRAATRFWVFGSLTNPRGGDNVKNTHGALDRYNPNWTIDEFDMFDEVKAEYRRIPWQSFAHTWEGKPVLGKWFENMYTVVNCLGICFMPIGFSFALGPTYFAEMLSACTGQSITPRALMEAAERVFNVLKAYNTRQGLTRKDDTWPDRFYEEPMAEGPAKGAVLSRPVIDRVLDEYYALRHWDSRGLPTQQTLTKLGLKDIADGLVKLGKIAKQ